MTATATISRYFCGCLYRSLSDISAFCPLHQPESPSTAFITGTETLRLPHQLQRNTIHRFQGLQVLENSDRNSLHVITCVQDAYHEEWSTPEADLAGLCCACFIDENQHVETGIAACECADPGCTYRWCGRTDGLHALWRIHARGQSQELTGFPDRELFAYGPVAQMNKDVTDALNAERQQLAQQANQALLHYNTARAKANPSAGRQRCFHPVYLSRWLDVPPTATPLWAKYNLTRKLTRLIVTGAIQPDAHDNNPPPQPQLF